MSNDKLPALPPRPQITGNAMSNDMYPAGKVEEYINALLGELVEAKRHVNNAVVGWVSSTTISNAEEWLSRNFGEDKL